MNELKMHLNKSTNTTVLYPNVNNLSPSKLFCKRLLKTSFLPALFSVVIFQNDVIRNLLKESLDGDAELRSRFGKKWKLNHDVRYNFT